MLPIRAGEIGTKFILERPNKIILCTLQALEAFGRDGGISLSPECLFFFYKSRF